MSRPTVPTSTRLSFLFGNFAFFSGPKLLSLIVEKYLYSIFASGLRCVSLVFGFVGKSTNQSTNQPTNQTHLCAPTQVEAARQHALLSACSHLHEADFIQSVDRCIQVALDQSKAKEEEGAAAAAGNTASGTVAAG